MNYVIIFNASLIAILYIIWLLNTFSDKNKNEKGTTKNGHDYEYI